MESVWTNAQLLNKYMNKAWEESGRVFEAKASNAYWLRGTREPMMLMGQKEGWVAKPRVVGGEVRGWVGARSLNVSDS